MTNDQYGRKCIAEEQQTSVIAVKKSNRVSETYITEPVGRKGQQKVGGEEESANTAELESEAEPVLVVEVELIGKCAEHNHRVQHKDEVGQTQYTKRPTF